jgi:hypothetical protein
VVPNTIKPTTFKLTTFMCGTADDGSDGCGAIVSFRPGKHGDVAAEAWNRRTAEPRLDA